MATEDRLSWALGLARNAGLRLTPACKMVLAYLSSQSTPVSLAMVCQADKLQDACDPATIFRTLMRFKKIGLAHQMGFHRKKSYFVLNSPELTCHYLICNRCGQISELKLDMQVASSALEAGQSCGFTDLSYEVFVYGICQRCRESNHNH